MNRNALNAPAEPDAPPRPMSRRRVWLLCAVTAGGWTLCFAPLDAAALAYVILAPWAVAVAAGPGRTALWAGWLTGLAAAMIGLYWLTWVTVIGYLGTALVVSGFWLIGAWFVRRAAAARLPLVLVLPVVWVALEFGRAWFLSGFPWFFLGHSQYRWVRLIQVADATGVYGITFVVAMANGLVADAALALRHGLGGRRRVVAGTVATAVLMAALLAYGTFRLDQARRTTTPGPTVAVVQTAVPIDLYTGRAVEPEPWLDELIALSEPLAEGPAVDLVVWPETVLHGSFDRNWATDTPWPKLDPTDYDGKDRALVERMQRMHRKLAALLQRVDAPLLAGGTTVQRDDAASGGRRLFNSALLMAGGRDGGADVMGVYHKVHCVPFSEYVPFEQGAPWLHRGLRRFVPNVMHQLTPGRRYERFSFGTTQPWRMAVAICYEGTFARVCRRLAHGRAGKQIDVLVNISNDGWFIYPFGDSRWASTELDQHLTAYVFRAIENRVPVVRAVNTGISGFIDSSGRIRPDTRIGKMMTGTETEQLLVDSRRSLYSLVGDLAALACSAATAGLGSFLWWRGHRARRMRKTI
ncbi:MAG: apolipoprotein N-acyltransferase [Planctomycetes bacterium]|nr:apolipoprotein N-acyltransferase [Planctomycetota bacterium]